MKKILNTCAVMVLVITGSMTFTSCTNLSPEKTFEIAALNSNLLSRFGSKEISEKLQSEPQIYNESQKKMVTSSYYDYFKFNIDNLEKQLGRIKEINEDDDNKELLQASKDLFTYAIAKQKEGYLPIAKMKDDKASSEQIEKAIVDFDASTRTEIDAKFTKLMNVAKAYVDKHNINAQFGI